jgi:hypothetical protein
VHDWAIFPPDSAESGGRDAFIALTGRRLPSEH